MLQQISNDPALELEEEFTCGCCYELMVYPTTLTCGHSFCRPCLAHWFEVGKKSECPTCRQKFAGLPSININLKSLLEKLYHNKYKQRLATVEADQGNRHSLEEFEKIVAERINDDRLSSVTQGCLVGTGIAFLVMICFYLAFMWGSTPSELLVQKPVDKWSSADVATWLEDIGLEFYVDKFKEQNINGRLLSAVRENDTEKLFDMNNTLHQRTFLHALNYTLTHQVKWPTNLWEFKAVHPGYTAFLVYSIGHFPRLAIYYLYLYDETGYDYFYCKTYNCSDMADCMESSSNFDSLIFWVMAIACPYYLAGLFVWCFLDMHYWTARIVLFQCVVKVLLDANEWREFFTSANKPNRIATQITEGILGIMLYCIISCFWWLIPGLIKDGFFYLELYFSVIFYTRRLMVRNNEHA